MRSLFLSQFGMTAAVLLATTSPATALKPSVGSLMNPLVTSHAPGCVEKPSFLTETHSEIIGGFEALPKDVYVARSAEMWVEGASSSVKLHSFQSFLKPHAASNAKILCGSSPAGFSDRFSVVAPTLIDLDPGKKVGHSLWQFQVIAGQDGYSVWNKKSPSFSKVDKLESLFKEMKTPYRLYQVGHNEFELVVEKESGGMTQTLSIKYEALR